MGAIEQLEFWKIYAISWCEHKPSVTISVKEEEWLDVGAWCWRNFDILSGISFLPYDDHIYQQAPYIDINKEDYEELLMKMPSHIDWTKLALIEKEDNTKGSQELACSSGFCEIV